MYERRPYIILCNESLKFEFLRNLILMHSITISYQTI